MRARQQAAPSLGQLLRQSRIDEIPQVWNVLRGDLSIVGPRPEQPHYVESFAAALPFYDLRHVVRPGITGWAQVNGRDELDLPEKVNLDTQYLQKQSTSFDFYILFFTVLKVFRREGVSH